VADHVPKRDLWVSPCHGLLIGGVLIPAGLLVNGVSILRADGIWEVDYFHIELERHAVILAENAPAETFIDAGIRRPRLTGGQELDSARERLGERARLPRFQARVSMSG
jgi:hypothetical protein